MHQLQKYGADERFTGMAAQYPGLELARVIAQYRDLYRIVTEQGDGLAEVSGKFRHDAGCLADYPAVGDFVLADRAETINGNAIIHQVLPRKSVFERSAVGQPGQTQVVAANVDMVFLCMSLNNNYSLSRLERYLSVAWDSGALPLVVLTKADLCADIPAVLAEISGVAIGVDIIVTSRFQEDTLQRLLSYLQPGLTASFIGSSGVGKSTLINLLDGAEVFDTSEIRQDGKGRHTTTRRELLLLPQGGLVIDTPGMREFGVESINLGKSFTDIEDLAAYCKFADCSHSAEPGCAVRQAVEEGRLEQRRLDNFLKLQKEARYDGLNSRQIEQEKITAMFGGKNEMKNIMDFLKNKKKL